MFMHAPHASKAAVGQVPEGFPACEHLYPSYALDTADAALHDAAKAGAGALKQRLVTPSPCRARVWPCGSLALQMPASTPQYLHSTADAARKPSQPYSL